MSVFRPEIIVCPRCGHRNEETVAVSLNGPRVPAVIDAIVDGTFQCFECRACGLPYRADGPVIYIDFDRKRWIGEIPTSMERSWALLEQQSLDSFRRALIDLAPAYLRSEADGFAIRTVFGLDALAEKIRLFDAGFDDRQVEVAKLAVLVQIGAVIAPAWRPRVVAADSESISLLVWRREGGADTLDPDFAGEPEAETVRVPAEEIARVAGDPAWAATLVELSIGPYVDLGRLLLDGRVPFAAAPA
ncbi:MAG TPA: CpXC domain-containing protein [Acidimicrobiales bacterium]|nr:CpXC domain-containing protein [Acidimicrobiales bacterium]